MSRAHPQRGEIEVLRTGKSGYLEMISPDGQYMVWSTIGGTLSSAALPEGTAETAYRFPSGNENHMSSFVLWEPDSRSFEVLYREVSGGKSQTILYKGFVDGSPLVKLLVIEGDTELFVPAVSPDLSRIAFWAVPPDSLWPKLWIFPRDGSNPVAVESEGVISSSDPYNMLPFDPHETALEWTADGKQAVIHLFEDDRNGGRLHRVYLAD